MTAQLRKQTSQTRFGRTGFAALVGLLFGVMAGLTAPAPAHSEPLPVLVDQNPMDCFSQCPQNWSKPVISIQKSGIFIGSQRVAEDRLLLVLNEEFRRVSGRWVFIRADADVPYGEFLRICHLVEAGGYFGRVRFVNEDIQ